MSAWRPTVRETAPVCRMPRPPSSASAILALKEKNAQVSKENSPSGSLLSNVSLLCCYRNLGFRDTMVAVY